MTKAQLQELVTNCVDVAKSGFVKGHGNTGEMETGVGRIAAVLLERAIIHAANTAQVNIFKTLMEKD